jgi:hypothetical protein
LSARVVSSAEFRQWITPLVTEMRDFAMAVFTLGERHGYLPDETSAVMREIAEEHVRRTWRLGALNR